jgi:hypothetical protein
VLPYDAEKEVRLQVIMRGGHWYWAGKEVPLETLLQDTSAELRVRAGAIRDSKIARLLCNQDEVQLLPAGTEVLMGVKVSDVPNEYLTGLRNDESCQPPNFARYVPVQLLQPLKLRKQGTKPGKLARCRCNLPTLSEKATSLNHAFTRISEVYEADRISHTGNVFERAYYQKGKHWVPLEHRREELEGAGS